jgi:hypothetical protein
MRRGLLPLLLVMAAEIVLGGSAGAVACHYETHTTIVNGHLYTQSVKICPGAATIVPVADHDADPPRDSELDAICVATAISAGADPFAFCDVPPTQPDALLTPDVVAAAFRVMRLPSSVLKVQPPNGRTLVNFDTNFFTDTQALDRSVMLLGRRVDLHIVPSEFGWRFGDGESLATAEPGSPYPHLDVTHRYLRKGRVAPSVDTTYTATYRVNGGGWRDVPGSVTTPGAPVALEVVTATPTLVGYDS